MESEPGIDVSCKVSLITFHFLSCYGRRECGKKGCGGAYFHSLLLVATLEREGEQSGEGEWRGEEGKCMRRRREREEK